MRILHTIHSADPAFGGPIESIRLLAAATPDLTHEVASLDRPGAPFLRQLGVGTHPLGPAGPLGYSPRLAPWVREHRDRYDAVLIHGLWRYVSFGTWRGLAGGSTPYFAMPHGMLDPWFRERYPVKHLKKRLFWPWTEYRVLRDAAAVIFTSEAERRRASESFRPYRCNEVVSMYGLPPPGGDPDSQLRLFLGRYPELCGKRVLLFLGRLHEKKGCDLALRAFARVCGGDPALHLVMAGPDATGLGGALRNEAASLGIAARVSWTGMISGDMKWGAYRASEAFLLPSHQENFGLTVVEALSCGLPVLLSDQVQIWEEVAVCGAGFVESDDEAGTGRLLARWLSLDADERAFMRRMALLCFVEKFDAGAWARRFREMVARHLPAGPRAALQPGAPAPGALKEGPLADTSAT